MIDSEKPIFSATQRAFSGERCPSTIFFSTPAASVKFSQVMIVRNCSGFSEYLFSKPDERDAANASRLLPNTAVNTRPVLTKWESQEGSSMEKTPAGLIVQIDFSSFRSRISY